MEDYGLFGAEVLTLKRRSTTWTFRQQDGKLMMKKIYQENSDIVEWEFQEVGSDFSGYFSFTFTRQDEINVIYKNNEEQVIYLAPYSKGKKLFFQMSFPEGEKITFQKIISLGNSKLMLLVFTENLNENRWKIYSCTKENEIWLETLIVDSDRGYGPGEGAIAIGPEGQVYLAYQKYNRGEYKIVYCINKNNIWSEPFPILFSQEFNFNLSITVDNNGKPHLVWLRTMEKVVRVMYSSRNRINNFWTRWQWNKEQVVSPVGDNYFSPYIIVKDKGPQIYWQVCEGNSSNVYCIEMSDKGQIKLIAKYKNNKSNQIMLDLDKYTEIINYSDIEKGSTLYYLFLISENKEENSEKGITEGFTKNQQYNVIGLLDELEEERNRVEKLVEMNGSLQNALLKKSEEYHKAQGIWKDKELELIKEIERLKQNQKAIQKTNEKLRQELRDREDLRDKLEENTENTFKPDVRKVYPHFPFIKKKF